jgi:hypothetical protein
MTTPRDGATAAAWKRPAAALLVLATVVALGLPAMAPAGGGTGGGARTTVVLGRTPSTPQASCPESPCRAVGSVTGFQLRNEEGSLPFRVPRDGRIVAWSITLSEPTSRQRAFFNGFFGRPPEAHIAILRRVPESQPPVFRLQRQSGLRLLSAYLGQTVRFRLGKPLPARQGDVVALSIPTWAPGFAFSLPADNVWRASRERGECLNPTDLRQGRPQQVVGSRRAYGCRYEGARLLYTATLVSGR